MLHFYSGGSTTICSVKLRESSFTLKIRKWGQRKNTDKCCWAGVGQYKSLSSTELQRQSREVRRGCKRSVRVQWNEHFSTTLKQFNIQINQHCRERDAVQSPDLVCTQLYTMWHRCCEWPTPEHYHHVWGKEMKTSRKLFLSLISENKQSALFLYFIIAIN